MGIKEKKVIKNTNYDVQFSYIVLFYFIIFLMHIAQRLDNERGDDRSAGHGNDDADQESIESSKISNYVDIEKADLIDDDDCVSIKSDGQSDDDFPKVVFKKPLEKTHKL